LLVDFLSVIDGQNVAFHFFERLFSVQPVFMFLVQSFKVVQWDGLFSLSGSLLDSLLTDFRGAANVNDSRKVDDFFHFKHVLVTLEVNFVFGVIEDVHIFHDAGKNEAIAEKRAFRDADAVAFEGAVLGPLFESAHESINLESEAPPLGVFVVDFEEVNIFLGTDILPIAEGFVKND
jgi:hypothetical protein